MTDRAEHLALARRHRRWPLTETALLHRHQQLHLRLLGELLSAR